MMMIYGGVNFFGFFFAVNFSAIASGVGGAAMDENLLLLYIEVERRVVKNDPERRRVTATSKHQTTLGVFNICTI